MSISNIKHTFYPGHVKEQSEQKKQTEQDNSQTPYQLDKSFYHVLPPHIFRRSFLHFPDGQQADENRQDICRRLREIDSGDSHQSRKD